ncbi:aminotransferase class I/II-fold pyridoxal phosphate-dependent enzyme [Candidatus Vidania fulgoroideorum]
MFNKKLKIISFKNIFKRKKDIDLSIGEFKKLNDILDKIKVEKKLYKLYPNINNFKDFNKSIKKWIKTRYNLNINNYQICPSLGNRDGLFTSFIYFLNKKKYIALFKPYYPVYISLIKYFNKKPLFLNEKNYKKKIKRSINKINFIIICSPNNPTGVCFNKNKFYFFKKINKKFKVKIISDECYSEIYLKKKPKSFLEFNKKLNNIIILNSLSKRSMVPGLRSGFLLSSKKIIKNLKIQKNISGTILSDYNKKISIFLWKNKKNIKKIKKMYRKTINSCLKLIRKNKINFSYSGYGFYFWIKTNKKFSCKKIYRKYSIKILPGKYFGKKKYIRIALVENLNKCIYSLKKIIKHLI